MGPGHNVIAQRQEAEAEIAELSQELEAIKHVLAAVGCQGESALELATDAAEKLEVDKVDLWLTLSVVAVLLFYLLLSPAPAIAQQACYTEIPCTRQGKTYQAALVPHTRLVACEQRVERSLFDRALQDGKTMRRERDQCFGELVPLRKRDDEREARIHELVVENSMLKATLESRWEWWKWALVGVGIGGAVVGGIWWRHD